MKKSVVFLIVLALLVAVGIFAVAAENGAPTDAVYCKRCNKYVPAEQWQEWTVTNGEFLQEGHFYLSDTFVAQESTVTIPALKFVCFDLRGNTWITEGMRTLTIAGDFSVMDSVGGGRILTTGENGKAGGFAYVDTKGALNLFGGTVQFVPREDIEISTGGLIAVNAGTVNVDGGTVTGGVVSAASDKNAFGGNIYLSGGSRLNVVSGTISKGMVTAGNSRQGGNVYATGKSVISVSGGSVENGYSAYEGGNIHLADGSKMYASGGEIRNGVAVTRGGNICSVGGGSDIQIHISGGTITGGSASGSLKTYKDETQDDTLNPTCARGEYGGGNIYGRMPDGSLVISGGTIDGDILLDYMGSLILSGAPKINLGLSNGLKINRTSIDADISGLEEGTMIYVDATDHFTKELPNEAAATAALAYFRGAVRTTVTASGTRLTATQGTQGYCPHCKKLVTWTAAISATNDGDHIYLNGSKYNSSADNLVVSKDTVLDLNGYTLFRDGNRIITYADDILKTLSVLDSWGGGKLEGTGTGNAHGGLIYMYSNSALELYSGTVRVRTSIKDSNAAKQVKHGGVIYATGGAKITMHGGQIMSGVVGVSGSEYGGGNICFSASSGVLTVNGGIIRSGKSENSVSLKGGNIYSAGTVEINGGVILGGSATSGGNIYSTKEIKITEGIVWGGTSTCSGGNIYAKKLTMSGGLVARGSSTGTEYGGGNIAANKGTVTISGDAAVVSGTAADRGGNVYCLQTVPLNIQGGLIAGGSANHGGNIRMNGVDCTTHVSGGLITMGEATTGGNVYVNNGTFKMTGGAVTAGTASNGGNLYLNYYVNGVFKDDGNADTALPVVSHGTATNGKGGNIAFMATGNDATLTYSMQLGNCRIYAGAATGNGDNVYINNKAKLEVLPEFAQKTSVYFHNDLIKDDIYLDSDHVCCNGVYAGDLLLENRSNLPKIITSQADTTLVIGQAALVMRDGTVRWFGSNDDAVAAYTAQTEYIQPGAGELALPAGTFVVDLTGQAITLTGDNANVYCFDSANASFNTWGTANLNGPVLMNTQEYTYMGTNYVTIPGGEGTYSFHCLDMAVTGVSVRPSTAGVYFSCTWNCDSMLKDYITDFGVAVSTTDMPDGNLATDKDTLYTKVSASDFEVGKEYNSVLINNIFTADADNNSIRGATPIYTTPYVTLKGGKQLVIEGEFKHSLQSVLKLFDSQAYYANKAALESFHQQWESAMTDWGFANIGVKPQDDDTLRILMGGNSFAYYYVEELYGLLMENLPEGVTAVEIYNIYYSGRGMYTHWYKWSTQAEGDYHLFKTDKNGRRELHPIGGWTLEEVLAMENWDYIGLQGKGRDSAGSYAEQDTWESVCDDLAIYAEALFGRIHEMFPYTQLLWHRTWAQEVGRVTNSGFTYTEEYNSRYDPGMQYVCDWMTEVFDQDKPYDLIQVNSGAAWKEARRLNEELDLLPYGGLCAMLARNTYGDGRPGSGDGQHDGDIGGGQLLNAYMWYMTITGDSDLTDNTFKPDYEMSDALWNMLKQAAMTTYQTYYLDN